MSHPYLDSHRHAYGFAAQQIAQDLAGAERRQLAEPISDTRRRRNISHLRRQADARLNQLRVDYFAGIPGLMRRLVDPLFRLPNQVGADLSWRDALSRAAEISDQDEALRLWRVSKMADDHIMLKALAFHACPNPEADEPPRWPKVVAAWAASDSHAMAAMQGVNDIWEETHDKQVQFRDALMFRLPPEQRPDPGPDDAADADVLPQLSPPPPPPAASA